MNARRKADQRKRGTFLMKDRAWLIAKYGESTAEQVMATKKEQQAKKKPDEPNYTMDNPDVPGSEETCM